jgi:hypothetical protein
MTIEHGHANNFANDYSSTAFWYQSEPHKAFARLPDAAARRPRDGDDPHDRAFRDLMDLRERALVLWLRSIRDGVKMPEDLQAELRHDVSRLYFDREYDRLAAQVRSLGSRMDALLQPATPAP